MEPLTFSDIAVLLNHSRTIRISEKPTEQNPNNWELFVGEHRIHTDSIPFQILYLQARATADGLREAARRVRGDRVYIVYAPSLDGRLKLHHDLFRTKKSAKRFWNTTDYLKSFFREELDAYNQKLTALSPKYYIDPDVIVPRGVARKIPNPLLSFLEDIAASSDITPGEIGVLLAEPGQGKTYMSQYLVAALAQSHRVFPIHISSDQWRSIAPDDFGDLAKTIVHSFRHFGTPIGWLDGCEDKFLGVTVKARLFRIVFDGFDEYVLRNRDQVSALQTLEALARFVDATGARIVVTSRSSFWNSELEGLGETLHGAKLSVYTQVPFDTGKARKYFSGRLRKAVEVERATSLYDALQKSEREFVGRGFVLNLLADLVSRADQSASVANVGNPVEWLMRSLCERERLRQELPLTAEEQLKAITIFVSETTKGAEPNSELLEIALSETAPHLAVGSRSDCISKLTSHPLIQRPSAQKDEWEIPQEQVRIVFLAGHLMSLARATKMEELAFFAASAKLEDSEGGDVAEMIVDLAFTKKEHGDGVEQLRQIIAVFLSVGGPHSGNAIRQHCLRQLAVMTALKGVDRFLRQGSTHLERTQCLVAMFPEQRLSALEFSGAITKMDFSDSIFDTCRFERVRWVNCTFSSRTRFKNCHFIGGSETFCQKLGESIWENLTADEDGHAFINTARVAAGSKRYSVEELRADVRAVVNKFIVRGGVGFRTVKESHLSAGTLRASAHRDEIIRELTKKLFETHNISGVSDKGFNVKEQAEESIRFYASNNVFTGPLLDAFEALIRRLKL